MEENRKHLERETVTIGKMVGIYCRGNGHSTCSICEECANFLRQVTDRIAACPYRNARKPACGLCKTTCFTPEVQHAFKQIMRSAGPGMMVRHPLLTIAHLFDALAGRKNG